MSDSELENVGKGLCPCSVLPVTENDDDDDFSQAIPGGHSSTSPGGKDGQLGFERGPLYSLLSLLISTSRWFESCV